MARDEVRFSVTDGSGSRAATWKLWAQTSLQGPEIYLTCRELGGTLHTSFHPSGEWHTRLSPEAKAKLSNPPNHPTVPKYVEEWERPREIVPGFVLAYKILTPWSSPTSPLEDKDGKLVQIANAPSGHANETAILIARSKDWQILNAEVIWCTLLSNGETLILANKKVGMPQLPKPQTATPRYFEGKSRADLSSQGLRALVFANDHNGHRLVLDTPVAPLDTDR